MEIRSSKMIARFRALPTGNISDAMDKLGISSGVLPGEIRAVSPHQPVLAGYACTVLQGIKAADAGPEHQAKQRIVIDSIAQPGEVVVIDAGNCKEVCTGGGLLAMRAAKRGLSGLVVNGCYRDISSVCQTGLPLFCTGSSPRKSAAMLETVGINVPLSIHGVAIRPGDIVVGDDTGVVVVPIESAEQVLQEAERIFRVEARMEELIGSGMNYLDCRKQAEEENQP